MKWRVRVRVQGEWMYSKRAGDRMDGIVPLELKMRLDMWRGWQWCGREEIALPNRRLHPSVNGGWRRIYIDDWWRGCYMARKRTTQ